MGRKIVRLIGAKDGKESSLCEYRGLKEFDEYKIEVMPAPTGAVEV